ncbi:PBECR2 nuclease fold domain-containing protein, partial [Coprobacter secundus]|uniref:ADP-ribosyltransferase-containing protein n=2 Tax=Bacteroidales TaxID=171549 RepID=UPI0022E7FE00
MTTRQNMMMQRPFNIYAIGKELYNIPDNKLREFLTDFPQAVKLSPEQVKTGIQPRVPSAGAVTGKPGILGDVPDAENRLSQQDVQKIQEKRNRTALLRNEPLGLSGEVHIFDRILGRPFNRPYTSDGIPGPKLDKISRQVPAGSAAMEQAIRNNYKREAEEYHSPEQQALRELDRINEDIDKAMTSPEIRRGMSGNAITRLGGRYSSMLNMYGNDTDMQAENDYNNLKTARTKINEARNTIRAAQGKKGFWKGLSDELFSEKALSLGLNEIEDGGRLQVLLDKAEKEGLDALTPSEKTLLDAVSIKSVTDMLHADNIPFWYHVGSGVGASIPYMMQFAVTKIPASAATKPLTRYITRRFLTGAAQKAAGRGVRHAAANFGRRALAGTANTALIGTAMAPLQPTTYSDILQRHMGQTHATLDENGKVKYLGQENRKSVGRSIAEGLGASTISNVAEMSGALLGTVGKFLKPGTRKVISATTRHISPRLTGFISRTTPRALDYTKMIKDKNIITGFRDFAKTTGWNGIAGETFEEFMEGTLNAVTIGDQGLEDIYNWENALQTITTVGIMSVGMSSAAATLRAGAKRKIKADYDRADRHLDETFPPHRVAEIKSILGENLEDQSKILGQMFAESSKATTPEERKQRSQEQAIIQDYIYKANLYEAYLGGLQSRIKEEAGRIIENLRRQANPDMGATIYADYRGQTVRITSGTFDIDPEGNITPREGSTGMLTIITPEGDTQVVSPSQLGKVQDYMTLDEQASTVEQQVEDAVLSQEESEMNTLAPGTVVSVNKNGSPLRVIVTSQNADTVTGRIVDPYGKPVTGPDGQEQTLTFTLDEIQSYPEEESGAGVPEIEQPVEERISDATVQDNYVYKGNEAEKVLLDIFDKGTDEVLPRRIETVSEFEREFSSPVRTVLGEVVKVGRNLYNKLVRNSRENISGAIRPTLEAADFVINDTDGSRLYVKMYKKSDGKKTYNVTVVNKQGEVEDYISSAHIKSENNLLNKIRNGAELSLPSERNPYGRNLPNSPAPISLDKDSGIIENRQAIEERISADSNIEAGNIPAIQRIPKDAQGNPLYEQADPDTAWDAIVEQAGGDEQVAQNVAASMLADKEAALKKLQKSKPKGGTTIAEKIVAEKERQAAIGQAKQQVDIWKKIAQTPQKRKHQAETEHIRQAEEEKIKPDSTGRTESDSEQVGNNRNGEESQGETVGEKLTREEVQSIIAGMEEHAEVAPDMELTIENWDAEFGENGIVQTPVGKVKMGENQFTKLMRQGRSGKLGMIKPTLENPDVIIEDESKATEGDITERYSSYVFVRTFKKSDGSRYYYFTSVTVSQGNMEVVVSNQEKTKKRISNLLQRNAISWINEKVQSASEAQNGKSVSLDDSWTATQADNNTAPLGINSSELSESKGSEKTPITSESGEKVAPSETETDTTPNETQAGNGQAPFLSESEYIDRALQEAFDASGITSREEWEDSEAYIDAYNRASDSYPDYILGLQSSGRLQEMYDRASIGERISIREGIETAGYKVKDILDTEKEKQEARKKRDAARRKRSEELMAKLGIVLDKANEADSLLGENGEPADGELARKVAQAEAETDTNPTDKQKEAGNYKKGHVRVDGLDITIEQPKGSVRSGVDANGNKWETEMHNTYGYIRGTEGVDGDHIDVFLSDTPQEGDVFVVDQVNKDGTFDEHKVMYGFPSEQAAREAYLSNYEEGWQGLGAITQVSKEEFRKWLGSSHRKTKPFAEYKSVKFEKGNEKSSMTETQQEAYDVVRGMLEDAGIPVEVLTNEQMNTLSGSGEVRLMGSRVDKRMAEIGKHFEGKELDDNTRAVVDVFSGKTDNKVIEVGRPEGTQHVVMRQGTENKAGTKHSLFRHFGTRNNHITPEDIVRIPEVIAKGERIVDGKKVSYSYTTEDGTLLRVTTEIRNRRETFTNFMSNRKSPTSELVEHATSAQASDERESDVKVGKKSESTNGIGEKPRLMTVYHGSGAEFDTFDHSHMGEGEGAQAYGWGSYVTEVEGIGRTYAETSGGRDIRLRINRLAQHVASRKEFIKTRKSDIRKNEDYDKYARSIQKNLHNSQKEYKAAERAGDKREMEFYQSLINISEQQLERGHHKHLIDSFWEDINNAQADIDKSNAEITDLKEELKKKSRHLYTVEIPDDTGENYLKWEEKPDRGVVRKIAKSLRDNGYHVTTLSNKLAEHSEEGALWGEYDVSDGEGLYRAIERILSGDRAASEFLSSIGFTGISYPAEATTGGRADGARNYVIFNEKDLKITNHISFLKDNKGIIYGATVGGKIYLNGSSLNPETPIHEYTHLWDTACQNINPELWRRGVELMKQTPLWEQVQNDPAYADLTTDDEIAGEVHSRLTGKDGAKLLEDIVSRSRDGNAIEVAKAVTVRERLRNWLKDFWWWLKDTLSPWTKAEAERVTIEDFVHMPLKDLVRGTDLTGSRMTAEESRIVERAKADGTYMKAPNGKPTNLSERQWVQIRTKAFKEWFGDWEKAALLQQIHETWNGGKRTWTYRFSPSEKLKKELKEKLGVEATSVAITDSAVRHIRNHHGSDEARRGQKDITPEDILTLEYLINNFDDSVKAENDNAGNPQIKLCKVTNGVATILTVNRGKGKEFVVTAWEKMSSASMINSLRPNVRNALDIANVQKDLREIRETAENSSKVIDENGEPRVVYHGTTIDKETKKWNEKVRMYDTYHEPFTLFKRINDGERNSGHFFNSDIQNAYDYGYNTYDTFLNLRNPLVIDAKNTLYSSVEYNGEEKDTYQWSEYAEKNGYDGVIFQNVRDGVDYGALQKPTTDYVAFSSNQIKSATDNTGEYSPADNDIRFHIDTTIQAEGQQERSHDSGHNPISSLQSPAGAYTPGSSSTGTDHVLGTGLAPGELDTLLYGPAPPGSLPLWERVAYAQKLKKELGSDITLYGWPDEVPADITRELPDIHKVQGFYDPKSGRMGIILHHTPDKRTIARVMMHEIVGHRGIRGLLGEQSYRFYEEVYASMPASLRESYTRRYGSRQEAADEYIADLAGRMYRENPFRQLWEELVALFRGSLRALGIKVKLNESDIRFILREARRQSRSGNLRYVHTSPGAVRSAGAPHRDEPGKSGTPGPGGTVPPSAEEPYHAVLSMLERAGIPVEILTEEEMQQLAKRGDAVLQARINTLNKAARTIRGWIRGNERNKSISVELPSRVQTMVRKAMGRDFDSHNITSNSIIHLLKNHGVNGSKQGQNNIPIREDDAELIPYIMFAPDYVKKGNPEGTRESVRFYKNLSNGYVVVVEKEQKDSPDDMDTITMWAELSSSNVTDARNNTSPMYHAQNVIISSDDITKIQKDAEAAI